MSTHSQPAQITMDYEQKDICVNRHGGNENSVAANPDADSKARMRLKLLTVLCVAPMCTHDFSEALGLGANFFSGRLTWLRGQQLIAEYSECAHKSRATQYAITDAGRKYLNEQRAVKVG